MCACLLLLEQVYLLYALGRKEGELRARPLAPVNPPRHQPSMTIVNGAEWCHHRPQ